VLPAGLGAGQPWCGVIGEWWGYGIIYRSDELDIATAGEQECAEREREE
jgi:hypothetical protein